MNSARIFSGLVLALTISACGGSETSTTEESSALEARGGQRASAFVPGKYERRGLAPPDLLGGAPTTETWELNFRSECSEYNELSHGMGEGPLEGEPQRVIRTNSRCDHFTLDPISPEVIRVSWTEPPNMEPVYNGWGEPTDVGQRRCKAATGDYKLVWRAPATGPYAIGPEERCIY